MIRLSSLRFLRVGVLACVAAFAATPARAGLFVTVDNATQRMTVAVDGFPLHHFKVSTGRFGHGTPTGTYAPERLARHWYSRKYANAPMPYSVFFHGPFAIHGTTVISRLGTPASHGCVRLHPHDAAVLFALVKETGFAETTITVVGRIPPPPPVSADLSARRRDRARPKPQVADVNGVDINAENVAMW